jgi:anaerobic magnesium-protoporphyrin IX monomethyl ester cyclase
MRPWRVLLWVKFMEAVLQVRPRALRRVFAHPDRPFRNAMKWYSRIGRQVWSYEIRNFLFRDRCRRTGPTLAEFWGRPQLEQTPEMRDDHDGQAIAKARFDRSEYRVYADPNPLGR